MFAFYVALNTWLDFALSHFAFYNCPAILPPPILHVYKCIITTDSNVTKQDTY